MTTLTDKRRAIISAHLDGIHSVAETARLLGFTYQQRGKVYTFIKAYAQELSDINIKYKSRYGEI